MRCKQNLGFLAVVLLLWAICVITVLNNMEVREVFHEMEIDVVPDAIAMTQMKCDATEIKMWTLTYIIRGNVERGNKTIKEWIRENWAALEKGATDHLELQHGLGPEKLRVAEAIVDLSHKLIAVSAEIIEAKDRGVGNDELFEKIRQEFGPPLFYPLRDMLDECTSAHLDTLSAAGIRVGDSHDANINFTVILSLIITLLVLVIGLVVDRLFVRYTTERKRAQEALQKAHDELEQRVEERTIELVRANEQLQLKITENNKAKAKIEHLNSVLGAIRNVNQLITREKDRDKLIKQACEDLIEARGYSTAWITLRDKTGQYDGCAEAGFGEAFSPMVAQLKRGELPQCCREAEEQPGVVILRNQADECHSCSLLGQCDVQDIMSCQLVHDQRTYGFMAIATPFDLVESHDDQALFLEVTGDIAFALHSIELEEERKQAEEALAAERERLDVTLRSIGDAVITTDINGTITMLNRVAGELTGWDSKEAVGRPLTEVFRIINEKTRKFCENPFEKVMLSGAIVGLANHTVLIAKDGTERLLSDSGAPIRNQSGNIIGVILVFRDVTEAQRLQEYVSRARRLETAGRIAGQIAHDFNNLLSPLVAYPEFIRNELDENHSAVELLNDMERVALRMADVNQQLLTLSRRGHYDLAPMNLNEVIREVINQKQPTPETLVIDTKLSEDLMNMKGGASQIHRIISNLVGNAMDAMKNVGRLTIKTENFYADTTSIRFGRVPRGEYVLLTVSDTGCGIPDRVLPKIFDPFFTTKVMDKGRGTGLGLSIVNAVVEDHGGHIDLETTIGEGTSFYMFFPITREVTETTPAEKDIVGGSERILVVDDDEIQRDVALRMLEKLGYHAGAVESGERALEFLNETPQDLLILDMVMEPGIDGTETYRRILEINPTQKAIIVSGYAESDRVEIALEMGAGAFVRKPLSLKVLAVAVRKELDRKLETA